ESERFLNLSMNGRSSLYAPSVVKAGSRLIALTRPSALTFADRGFSLGGSLATFPAVTAQDTVVAGVLNGAEPFTLVLTGAPPADLPALVTALNAAISAAGLGTRLQAARADALGAASPSGNHLKLTSLEVTTNPTTKAEFSSVQVTPAAANDLS